jgi:hypothetical protein
MKETINLCRCNNCDTVLIDTNPQFDAPKFEADSKTIMGLQSLITIEDTELERFQKAEKQFMQGCPKCLTDDYLSDIHNAGELPEGITMLKQS